MKKVRVKRQCVFVCVLLLCQVLSCCYAKDNVLSLLAVDYRALISQADLFYDKPVIKAVEGQPIGNGVMGTLVWTTPNSVDFQINRVDVFAVNKNHKGMRDGPADYCGGCAKVTIDVGGDPFEAGKTFEQELSLYDALDAVKGNGVNFRCFVSAVSDVLILEIDDTRAEPKPVKLSVSMWRQPQVKNGGHTASYEFKNKGNKISLIQKFTEGDYYCGSAVSAMIVGSKEKIEVASEKECVVAIPAQKGKRLILISSAASFSPKGDVGSASLALLEEASKQSYDTLFTQHSKWWHDFWSRTFVHLTSDDGIAEFMQSVRNLHLYYMASSSRGVLPTKWNASIFAVDGDKRDWGSQFWVWTTEISHFALHASDAGDLADPWFRMYVKQLPDAEKAGLQRFNSKGAYIPETVPFDGPVVLPDDVAAEYQDVYLGRKPYTELTERARSFGLYEVGLRNFTDGRVCEAGRYSFTTHIVSSGSEVAAQAWWRYRHTGDKEWLRNNAYPLLRGTLEFYRNYARKGQDGLYHLDGLNQHEGFWGVNDGLIDLAAIRGTAPLAIRAAEILGVDADLRDKWQEFLDNLVPYPMGSDPDAIGVAADDIWAVGHKGPSNHGQSIPGEGLMWPIFPFEDWTLETKDPKTDYIAQKFGQLNPARRGFMNVDYYFNSACRTPIAGSRLGRGDDLPAMLAGYYRGYKPIQNGMSFFEGATAQSIEILGSVNMTLQEGLLQSLSPRPGQQEVISVFPAWPKEWNASYRLLARGGFLVTSAIKDGKTEFIEIESRLGESCRVRNPWGKPCVLTGANGSETELTGEIVTFDTKAGEFYQIRPKGSTRPANLSITPKQQKEPLSYSMFGKKILLSRRFYNEADLDGWEIKTGKPKVESNGLISSTTNDELKMITQQKFNLPLTIEYEIYSDNPGDYSIMLGQDFSNGLFLQLAGFFNKTNTIRLDNEELMRLDLDEIVKPGEWLKIRWDVTDNEVVLSINSKVMTRLKTRRDFGLADFPLGFFVYSKARIRNLLVCTSQK